MGQFIKKESDQVGIAEITYLPKVTALRSNKAHRIDCNGVVALRGKRHMLSKN